MIEERIVHNQNDVENIEEILESTIIEKYGIIVGDDCINCQICSKVCPRGNITFEDEKPVNENIYNKFEPEFNRCVPKSGYANTVAGEILRAWMRVLYRAVNDGDLIGNLENNGECESAAAYVYSNICKYGDTYDIHDLDLSINWNDKMDFINGNIIRNKVHNLLTYHKAESQLIDEYLCIHKQNAGFILDWLKANPILFL